MERVYAFLISLLILVVGVVVMMALFISNNKTKENDRFSVSANGSVYAKADIANVTIGYKTDTKTTASEATKENAQKTNNIISEIKKLNIDDKDIKTSNYNLNPVYDWTQNSGQQLKGYEASQNLNIKVRDANKIGDVISKAAQFGANQIGGINFTIDDETALKNQAREVAIKNAKEKAQVIAQQTGMKLGSIKNVVEGSESPNELIFRNANMAVAESAKQDDIKPQIQTGQNEIKVNVTLTYEVK